MERHGWPPRRANYFFALLPTPAAAVSADRMAGALRHWFGLSGRPRGIEKYHVSLWGWPWSDEPDLQELALLDRAAGRIRQRPFELRFDEVACFAQRADRSALVVTGGDGVIGAERLHDALCQELRASGIRGRRASGQPHLTLLYDPFRSDGFRVRALRWRVTEFVLIHSLRGERYRILGSWPLIGP